MSLPSSFRRVGVPRLAALALAASAALVAGCAKDVTRYGDARGVETVTNQRRSGNVETKAL